MTIKFDEVLDGKIIFNMALTYKASSIIVAHNHPSGNLNPSVQDVNLTNSLREFGKLIDLPLLDHLIFTDNGYFSFAEQGLLN
jgi:DNA repair protein RadC